MQAKPKSNRWKKRIAPFLFLLPVYLLIVTFKYYPFAMAVWKSFFHWDGGKTNVFVGLKNYVGIFADKVFFIALGNAVLVCIAYVLIAVTIPLLAAELVFSLRSHRWQYITRTLFTFPMVVPGVVNILLWRWIFAGNNGILNSLLEAIGLGRYTHAWLGTSNTALGSIVAIGFPWLGMAMLGGMQFLMYYGALQSIPQDLIEVSQIDGIHVWQRVLYIDLPMLSSQFKTLITLALIGGLQIFDSVQILTRGGPGVSTMVPAVYLYEQGFNYGKMGYSSAVGVVLFLLILCASILTQKLMKNTEKLD